MSAGARRGATAPRGAAETVRMGPLSLFALVVALCLAVMAVLSVATANASMALAERQASFTRAARGRWARGWTTLSPPAPTGTGRA